MALSKVDLANQVENQLPQNLVANNLPFRNIIINGDMSIAQRGTSATGLGNVDSGYHTCDRWRFNEVGVVTFEFTQSQSTDVPSGQGFATSLKMDCTTADASLSSSDVLRIQHRIEGQNLQYLKKGTANAESVTLSFWVKSNKTGTYIVQLYDNDNNRTISNSYTINSASTWEKKTLTYVGDTTGAFDNDNSESLAIQFYLAVGTDFSSGTLNTSWNTPNNADTATGQVNLADSTANEFYITGIQLEAGTTASDFEFLPVDINLQRCLRYYELIVFDDGQTTSITNASVYDGSTCYGVIDYTAKRTTPSLDQTTGTSFYKIFNNGSNDPFDSFTFQNSNTTRGRLFNTDAISATAGHSGWFATNNASSYLALDAEL
jgi:hypothetical protein